MIRHLIRIKPVTVKIETVKNLKLKASNNSDSDSDKEYSDGFAKAAEAKEIDPLVLVEIADVLELHL